MEVQSGDRVGWGYAFDSCSLCRKCVDGFPLLCKTPVFYGGGSFDSGSFATGAVRKESFVSRLPEGLSSEDAAPLMCGGITVFAPLVQYGAKPSDVVGIVGLGGLGHLAVQFARAMGCEVVVFSQTDAKKEDALKLGASRFVTTQGKKDLTSEVSTEITFRDAGLGLVPPHSGRRSYHFPFDSDVDGSQTHHSSHAFPHERCPGGVIHPVEEHVQ
jgi:D-arabinose 1-dehydrogenase-like Zn-dependent alcohol dehydrogenase